MKTPRIDTLIEKFIADLEGACDDGGNPVCAGLTDADVAQVVAIFRAATDGAGNERRILMTAARCLAWVSHEGWAHDLFTDEDIERAVWLASSSFGRTDRPAGYREALPW